jgi:hypothetical protein
VAWAPAFQEAERMTESGKVREAPEPGDSISWKSGASTRHESHFLKTFDFLMIGHPV